MQVEAMQCSCHNAACLACVLLITGCHVTDFQGIAPEIKKKKRAKTKVPVRIVVVELAKRKNSYTISDK